jgi:hypothetical protein
MGLNQSALQASGYVLGIQTQTSASFSLGCHMSAFQALKGNVKHPKVKFSKGDVYVLENWN